MIELKNSELEQTLLTISTYNVDTKTLVSGLLAENITLGTRRKLQKIHKLLYNAYTEFSKEVENLKILCGEDMEKLKKELQELFDEPVKIDAEKFLISSIEDIKTTNNYNFEIIEKIAI